MLKTVSGSFSRTPSAAFHLAAAVVVASYENGVNLTLPEAIASGSMSNPTAVALGVALVEAGGGVTATPDSSPNLVGAYFDTDPANSDYVTLYDANGVVLATFEPQTKWVAV